MRDGHGSPTFVPYVPRTPRNSASRSGLDNGRPEPPPRIDRLRERGAEGGRGASEGGHDDYRSAASSLRSLRW
jgi:hypothetical protein